MLLCLAAAAAAAALSGPGLMGVGDLLFIRLERASRPVDGGVQYWSIQTKQAGRLAGVVEG